MLIYHIYCEGGGRSFGNPTSVKSCSAVFTFHVRPRSSLEIRVALAMFKSW